MIQRQRLMRFVFSSLLFLLLSACVGPLVVHETARTVGDGNAELIAGYGNAGVAAKLNYGLNKDWDLGVQFESLSLGLRTKYAFINNNEKGWSLAAALGTGASIGGSHYYGDLIASYLDGHFEPYAAFRYVHMKIDPVDFKDEKTGTLDYRVDLPNYEYGQVMIGTRYWFDKHWLFSLEFSRLFAIGKGVYFGPGLLASGAFGYRF